MPALLRAVQPMAHRVQVQHQFARVLGQAAHAQGQQTGFQLLRIVRQLVATGLFVVGQLQPIERGRRRQRGAAVVREHAVLAQWITLLAGHRQQRIAAQLRVVVEVFVAQRQGHDPLGQQFGQRMIHEARVAVIAETVGQRAAQPEALVHLPEQQRAAVGGEGAPGEIGHDLATAQVWKEERWVVTDCRRSGGGVRFHWAQ